MEKFSRWIGYEVRRLRTAPRLSITFKVDFAQQGDLSFVEMTNRTDKLCLISNYLIYCIPISQSNHH
jgi:hypothetical protein